MPLIDYRGLNTPKPANQWTQNQGFQAPTGTNPTRTYKAPGLPGTGMSTTAAPAMNYTKAPMPGMGTSFQAAPAQSMTQAPGPQMGQDFQSPMPEFNSPNPSQGFQSPGFNTQYGTQQNVEAYMNPYLDQIIGRGNQAIQSSAAAKGLLGSSRTINDIGDWTAQATANEYGNAFNRFNEDRGYMTDTYRDSRNFDYGNYRDTNAWNYGMFQDEKTDYDNRMKSWYDQINGITNTGINASANAGTIQNNLGQALAQLYGNQGNVGAAQSIQQGNNNSGLLGGLLQLLISGGG